MPYDVILDHLKSRYTTKAFDQTKLLNEKKISFIKEVFQLSPSSVNIQPWKLLIISNPEIKSKLAAASWDINKQKVEEASHILVFLKRTIDKEYIYNVLNEEKLAKNLTQENVIQRAALLNNYIFGKDNIESWVQNQVYINLGFMLASLAQASIDSCPLEGINHKDYDTILGLNNSQFSTSVALLVGKANIEADHNHPSKVLKARLKLEDIIEEIN